MVTVDYLVQIEPKNGFETEKVIKDGYPQCGYLPQPLTSSRNTQRETPKQKNPEYVYSEKRTFRQEYSSCPPFHQSISYGTGDLFSIKTKMIHTEEENQVARTYLHKIKYGVAAISRLLKIIGLFCRIWSLL